MRAGWPCLVVHQIFSIFHSKLNTWLKSIFQIGHLHNLETIHASMLSMSSCPSDIYYPANHRCCPIVLTGKGKARKKKQTPSSCNKTSSGCHMPRLASLFRKLPQLLHIPDNSGSWPENWPFVLDILERSSFFWGQNFLVKSVFFRRDYLFQTFFSSQMESLLGLVSVEGDGNDPCQVFSLVVILLSLFYSEDVFWLVHHL